VSAWGGRFLRLRGRAACCTICLDVGQQFISERWSNMRARSGWFTVVTTVMILGLVVALVGCQSKKPEAKTEAPPETQQTADIIDTAIAAGTFTTLVSALGSAGLVETLKGPGPFTVFAPTDDAFAALAPGTLDELLKPEKVEELKAILTYHVVPGKVTASDIANLVSTVTVNGTELRITVQDSTVMVNDAKVTQTDIAATNGVIHVIDRVLIPPKQ
jgi:uncharacterized surface protein with fasciclin (FAS1) repeats